MERMLDIPIGRKTLKVGRLCVMMGLTGLLYLYIAHRFGAAAKVIVTAMP